MARPGRPALLALLCLLAAPAAVAAAPSRFGSSLAAPANAELGCQTRLAPYGGSVPGTAYGDLVAVPSGTPDCTWWQSGAAVVPGDGSITRISVKSGPRPAILRFVVARNLQTICCFFVAETSLSRPRANAVTSYAVDLPVERNTNVSTGVRTDDFIGVSAVSGSGSLPIAEVGPHNVLTTPFTVPQVGAAYPRISSASDSGGGIRPDGYPGFEVLLQAVFCPRGDACERPSVSGARFEPARFRVAPGAGAAAAPRGSRLRFRSSRNGSASIAIERRRGRSWTRVGTLRRRVRAGVVSLPFSGRVGRRGLRPGRYRAVVAVRKGRRGSRPRSAGFRIVR